MACGKPSQSATPIWSDKLKPTKNRCSRNSASVFLIDTVSFPFCFTAANTGLGVVDRSSFPIMSKRLAFRHTAIHTGFRLGAGGFLPFMRTGAGRKKKAYQQHEQNYSSPTFKHCFFSPVSPLFPILDEIYLKVNR